MRIVAWNVAHQVKPRPIPPSYVEALQSLDPDVIVLTEFVPAEVEGRSRAPFYKALESAGMKYLLPEYPPDISRQGTRNHTLIASSLKMERGGLRADTTDLPGPTGFLHVRFPDDGIEVAGVRIPSYKKPDQMHRYWRWLADTLESQKERSLVVIGDLNVNPQRPSPRYKGTYLQEIEQNWRIPVPDVPAGKGSCISKAGRWSSIDHAIVSKRLDVLSASYVTEKERHTFAGPDGKMSDHAVLVLEITHPVSRFH